MYSSNKPRKGSVDSIWLSSTAMKEICKCCRKDLGLISGNIALFRGKCMGCRQKICTDCVVSSLCHKCRVKRYITLNPKELMKLPSKRLIEISATLHFHNPQGYEKSELVQLILAIYGCKWKRPIPQQPGNADDEETPVTCVLCETEPIYMQLVFCQRCTVMLNQPDFLMNLPGRQLQCILKLLKIPEQDMKVREKGELVTLVLSRIGSGTQLWKPPLPQQPSTSNPQHNDNNRVQSQGGGIETPERTEIVGEIQEDLIQLSETARHSLVAEDHELASDNSGQQHVSGAESIVEPEPSYPQYPHIEHARDIIDEATIQQLRIHQLKSVLRSLDEETDGFCERKDLMDRVTEVWRHWKAQNELRETMETNSSHVRESESDGNAVEGKIEVFFPRDVPKLKGLADEDAIRALSVRQLKMILQKHSVNYTGCRERKELADKVVNLWKEDKKYNSDLPDEDLCKICMDAPIDCVLLECGHMVACTECGRQMSECPVCREFVVRVVHTFKG